MSPRLDAARFRGRDGFTLLEALVAFTVMALLLSVLFRGVVTMRAGSNAFDDRTHEDLVARAVLDDALANRDLRNGRYSGTRDGRHWWLVAKPMDIAAQLPTVTVAEAAADETAERSAVPFPALQGAPIPSQGDAVRLAQQDWTPQRLVVQLQTNGQPIEIETIRLVKAQR